MNLAGKRFLIVKSNIIKGLTVTVGERRKACLFFPPLASFVWQDEADEDCSRSDDNADWQGYLLFQAQPF